MYSIAELAGRGGLGWVLSGRVLKWAVDSGQETSDDGIATPYEELPFKVKGFLA
jgi:hypothetical protein